MKGERKEMPQFRCRDIGLSCPYVALYDTEEKLVAKVREHAKRVHGLAPVPPDVWDAILDAIQR